MTQRTPTGYIDFVFINSYAYENIINCDVLQHNNVNSSDHLGVMYELCVKCPNASVDGLKDEKKSQRRPKWEDAEFRIKYLQSLRSALASIPAVYLSCVRVKNGQAVMNSQCKQQLKDAIHQAASAGHARFTTDRRRRVHWWSHDCTLHRDRTRLYLHIWKCMAGLAVGKRTSATRTLDETTKRRVVIRAMQLYAGNKRRLLKCNKFSGYWRVVNQAKSRRKHECKVAIDNLYRNILKKHLEHVVTKLRK